MADNYLEKKMEEFKAMPSAGVASKNSRKQATILSKLVAANKFFKSFSNRIIVREQHLKDLINFVSEHNSITCASSAKLHFYPTVNAGEVSTVLDFLKKQNPQLLDFENIEHLPKSFILVGCNRPASLDTATSSNKFPATTDSTANESSESNESNELNMLYFQFGVISNTITLRATEMGLNGSYALLSGQNNLQESLQDTLKLPFVPLVAIAIGKGE